MTGLDVVLLLACAAFAWAGFRRGFLVGVFSLAGFIGGGVLGILITPRLVDQVRPGTPTALVALSVVVLLAAIGQTVFALGASSLRSLVRLPGLRVVDSVVGAVASVVVLLVGAWFVASTVRPAQLPVLSAQVRDSRVLAAVDGVVPDGARGLFTSFRRLVDGSRFPTVFGGFDAEPISPVAPPASGTTGSAAVQRAAGSVVRIDGVARSCSRSVEGSGFVYAPERVMTNAHVVAGVRSPRVRVGGSGEALPATVVAFDAGRDVAVLAVPGLRARALPFDGGASRGDDAVVAGFPGAGPYRLDAARVREQIQARGPDIYDARTVERQVLSLFAVVRPGNSGGPLLSPRGSVYGVVFATSLDDPQTGYALTAGEVASVAAGGRSATRAVDTGGCAS